MNATSKAPKCKYLPNCPVIVNTGGDDIKARIGEGPTDDNGQLRPHGHGHFWEEQNCYHVIFKNGTAQYIDAESIREDISFEKVVRLGSAKRSDTDSRRFCTYVKIKFNEKGNLSMSGVEGPFQNGNAFGSCGQIYDQLTVEEYAPGWDAGKVAEFAKIWDKWHLNDMNANCEHQVGPEWTHKDVEVVTYGLETEHWQAQKALKADILARLISGEKVQLTQDQIALLSLPLTTKQAPDADSFGSGMYQVDKRETKSTGWLTTEQHPEGFLSKPCPVCGYKYGNGWNRVEVPQEVIDWLKALPDTDREPAWV